MTYIKFKRSAVSGKVPTISDIDLGELAINTYDGKLFIKKDDGTQSIVDITAGGGGGGGGTVTSVTGTGTVSGLTLTGTVTGSGSLVLGGAIDLISSDITDALGFTPYNATNPNGYTSNVGTVTSVSGTGTVNGITLTGSVTSSGSLTLGGTLSNVSLTTQVSGILPIANGGTNASTATTARSNLGAAASGANSDITALSGITGGISSPDFIQFDTAAAATGAVGKLLWNDTDGTLDLGLKGGNVTLQVGQEQVIRITNQSGGDMTDGQVVYITGSTGNHLNVTLAQANAEVTSSKTIAVVTEPIANNGTGFATSSGLVRNLNTSALTEGAAIWLSASVAGGLTSTRPTAPDHAVLIGWCVKQHATVGVIYVHIANGYEIDELHDVKITGTPTAGSLLIRNATNAIWENARLTAGTGVSIANADKSITITNSAPDQVVSLTGSGTTSISGTYPNFTISSADQYSGTVTSVSGTGSVNGITLSGSVTSSGSLTLGGTLSNVSLTTQVSGILPVANGGTGLSTVTANAVVLGNGTSALQAVAPGTAGNVLTSNGTTWVSSAPASSGISQAKAIALSMIFGM